jgi:ketosteroid isomerase-like protein
MRGLFAAGWIAVSTIFAVPAFAQTPSDAVRATIEKYFAAVNSGNVSAAASEPWREDAVDINSSGLISGKAQIFERLSGAIKIGAKFEHRIDRIDIDGPIAWAAGQYTVKVPSKDGGSVEANGAWLHVLKQENGAWKFQAVCFSRTNQPRKE